MVASSTIRETTYQLDDQGTIDDVSEYHSQLLHGESAIHLRLIENFDSGIPFRIWSAGPVLCRWLESEHVKDDKSRSLKGRKVLELGAGCGLVGLLCAHLGADVTLTDTKEVMAFTQSNVDKNALPPDSDGRISVRELLWGTDSTAAFERGSYDLVVGSDVTYYQVLFEPLMITLLQLAHRETEIILAHTCRWGEERETWRSCLEQYFELETIVSEMPQRADGLSDGFEIQQRLDILLDPVAKEKYFPTHVVRLRLRNDPLPHEDILKLMAAFKEDFIPTPSLDEVHRSAKHRDEMVLLPDIEEPVSAFSRSTEIPASSSRKSCCIQ